MRSNVIQFPRRVSAKKFLRERMTSRRLVLALSLLSVVMICTSLNHALSEPTKVEGGARGVASLHSPEDINIQLRQLDSVSSVQPAEKPSRLDQLVVGELKGQVHVEMDGNKIVHLDWGPGFQNPISKSEAEGIVHRYKDLFAEGEAVFDYAADGSVQSISILK